MGRSRIPQAVPVSGGDDGADPGNAGVHASVVRVYAHGCEAPLHPMTLHARAGGVHRAGACGYERGVHAGEHDYAAR